VRDDDGEKITMMQQHATIDLRCRLTVQNVNFSDNVSSLETVCLTTVKC